MTIAKNPWRWIFLIGAVLWMCFIFGMSAAPGKESDETSGRLVAIVQQLFFQKWADLPEEEFLLSMSKLNYLIRKMAHFTEFAVLGTWLSLFFMTIRKSFGVLFCGAMLIGTLYSAADEIHQLFVSERNAALFDVFIDIAGVFAGAMIVLGLFAMAAADRNGRLKERKVEDRD